MSIRDVQSWAILKRVDFNSQESPARRKPRSSKSISAPNPTAPPNHKITKSLLVHKDLAGILLAKIPTLESEMSIEK